MCRRAGQGRSNRVYSKYLFSCRVTDFTSALIKNLLNTVSRRVIGTIVLVNLLNIIHMVNMVKVWVFLCRYLASAASLGVPLQELLHYHGSARWGRSVGASGTPARGDCRGRCCRCSCCCCWWWCCCSRPGCPTSWPRLARIRIPAVRCGTAVAGSRHNACLRWSWHSFGKEII